MSNEGAISCIKTFMRMTNGKLPEFAKIAIEALEQQDADGCVGCAFIDTEEWEMPCVKCRRACKDYWRAKHDE